MSRYEIEVPAFDANAINMDKENTVCVEDGFGVPVGALGTGYSVLGKYGFLREQFNSAPDMYKEIYPYKDHNICKYDNNSEYGADYNFTIKVNSKSYVLSEFVPAYMDGQDIRPVSKVEVQSRLPKSFFRYTGIDGVDCSLTAYSPLIPGDLVESNTPAQIFDFVIQNSSGQPLEITIQLHHRHTLFNRDGFAVPLDKFGETAFGVDSVDMPELGPDGNYLGAGPSITRILQAGEKFNARFVIAWFYPHFKTPSPCATDIYERLYTKRFEKAVAVAKYALSQADIWSRRIDEFHANFNFPGAFTRIWFGCLSSLITGSMLGSNGEYFEIETPHAWVNTMDVSAYASWCVMLLYPELERVDMQQYVCAIATEGEQAGFVWHSLWNDACQYAEEPTFIARYCRDFFFFRDTVSAAKDWPLLTLIMEQKLKECASDDLIDSAHGNQSYDGWKMPGISMYVNTPWIYALLGYTMMAGVLGKSDELLGESSRLRAKRAAKALDEKLWNESAGCYDCFKSDQSCENHPDSVFLDQLFGLWLLSVLKLDEDILPADHVKKALDKLYTNNLLTSSDSFRGWVNGMRPDGSPDITNVHINSCWLGPQLDFAALLLRFDSMERALDVWASIEWSMQGNQLAVGEWNKVCDADHKPVVSPIDPMKDTPRFPSYPRYKSSWESLICLLGITLDWDHIYIKPCNLLDFNLGSLNIAGIIISVKVERNWTRCLLDGQLVAEIKLSRDGRSKAKIEFLK